MELSPIFTLAAKEFRDRLRNRWVLAVALVFTVFSVVITYFGGAQQGAVGLRSIEFTIASLVSLVIYLIPLIALLLGFDAIVGERERGSLDLLLSMPITRLEVLLGKYLGLAAALTLSTLAGFLLVGVLLWRQWGWAGLFHYGGFVMSSVLLGLVFLSLALLLSVVAHDRARASGLAIATWFFFVLVFDLVLLGVLVTTGGRVAGDVFAWLLLLNPADVFRILNVFSLDDMRKLYGLASVVPPALGQPLLMGAVMLAWIVAPLALAGCSNDQKTSSGQPVEIDRATSCELDGMLLADYPGPKGQIHYQGQERPAFFCDTLELLHTLIAGEQVRAVQGAWVQDMARANWDNPQGAWIDARQAVYVLGSKRRGSMGPTAASFADAAAAQQFANEHGGKVLRFADIEPAMVDLSGGALHDTRM